MLTRTIALFAFGLAAVLFGASQSEAQPGRGFGKGPKGPEAGSEVEKLEKDLNRLLEQVKEAQAHLARLKEGAGKKGGFEKGKGKGFEGWKGFEGKKGRDWKGSFGGKGPGGFGPKGEKGPPKMDADTIKQKYEYYKNLYEESQRGAKRGKGKGGPKGFQKPEPTPATPSTKGRGFGGGQGSSSVEARIDRLIRELEQLRSEVKGGGKKKN
jgi:outer membrane murein-binding lipoprotein Lpp